MYIVLLILHVLISLALMIAVLLQSGRGGGLAGAFGGGSGSQAIFGGRGAATFLSKATTVLGASFMVSSLLLAVLSSHRFGGETKSALEKAAQATEEPASLPGPGESGFPTSPAPTGTPAGAPGAQSGAQPGAAPQGTPITLPAAGTAVPGTPAPGATTPAPAGSAPTPVREAPPVGTDGGR
jgi:preprotein translocase subunit SecG